MLKGAVLCLVVMLKLNAARIVPAKRLIDHILDHSTESTFCSGRSMLQNTIQTSNSTH